MKYRRQILFEAALAAILMMPLDTRAESRVLALSQQWSGSIADLALKNEAPANGCVTDAKTFEKLWKAWKIGEKVPDIDFKTEMVVVTTTRGSRLRLTVRLDEKGDLRVDGVATRDLRPGFRYAVGVIKREGVKTIRGKELPKD
ncbi:MAG TPA: hypothetical protein VN688_31925 [Gemmataceae bacterium]|nr:hypothetical protein [Gemmataceae bacterium]